MARQQAILDQKATLERQLANIRSEIVSSEQNIDSIESQIKSIAENRRDGTSEQKRLKDVSFALKAEHPKLAFRPPHFDVVDHGTEIKILTYARR
jgi:predicted  nucleic acid-binding Zn-ribbon protein